MSKETNYKTVVITGSCGNGVTTFSSFVNVEFVPDEIRLKHVCRTNGDTGSVDPMLMLRSNLINNTTLYAFPDVDNYYNSPDLRFKTINQPIPNIALFEFVTISGAIPTNKSTFDTKIMMVIEFIKF